MKQAINGMQAAICTMAILTSVALCRPAFGQELGPPPPGAMEAPPSINVDKQLTRWTKRYTLSDAQQAQIRPILVEEKKQIDALFGNSALSPEERFESMRTIHDDEVSKVSAILTDDQRAKYRKDQERMDRRPGPDGADGPPMAPPSGT